MILSPEPLTHASRHQKSGRCSDVVVNTARGGPFRQARRTSTSILVHPGFKFKTVHDVPGTGIIRGPMAESRPLLTRLLETPDLAQIVVRLQPELLHRVIQTCGLEDCAEFVALATPAQLTRVLDLDLWRSRTPGVDEEFDADRFGVWLEVLLQSGAAVAAEKLAGLDIELVVAGFAGHIAVRDHAAISSYTTLDGEHVQGRAANQARAFDIGGYAVEARRTSAWDAIADLLAFLEAEQGEYFHRLMRGCVQLSNGPREEDGFHDLLEDDEQHLFDLARVREARRERQGYVTPAQAQAFLREGRRLELDADRPPRSAIARAYFREIEPIATDGEAPSDLEPDAVADVVEALREAGVVVPPPRALLAAGDPPSSRLALLQAHAASHPASAEELAYLANTMLAGGSIQGRPFTAREASDAVASTCNLGLENWPSPWSDRDLITAFQIGWAVLHRDVCVYSAQRLIDVLAGIRCSDRDIDLRLDALRRQLIQHVRDREPWRSRNALDVILMLDAPSWAAVLALIDECPVIHAALRASRQRRRTISPTDFEFISENGQIAAVREFMASLGDVLTR
jgi:hypothetical protein